MFLSDQYELLDFGAGRKLERFGPYILDRPSPPAVPFAPENRALWKKADARFIDHAEEKDADRQGRGEWIPMTPGGEKAISGEVWTIRHQEPNFALELKASPFGHLGIFPEQSRNWDSIYALCRRGQERLGRPLRVLNLFAYTGGSSLAAAAGGAEVTHLDAAQNILKTGRRNAEASALPESAIRWIADDASKFVRRERKRENRYDGVILDPPSYGHGARGEVWRLSRDLPRILEDLLAILSPDAPFILLTCHTPGYRAAKLRQILQDKLAPFPELAENLRFSDESGSLSILSSMKKRLPAGEMVFLTPSQISLK